MSFPGGEKEDVTRFVPERGLTITVPPSETREEIAHRLEIDRAEREHQRRVELDEIQHGRRVFWAFSSVLTVVLFLSFLIVLGAVKPGPEDSGQGVEWARTIISAIIAGLAGYLLPRARR
jgi:hypothetical protein